MLLEIGILFVPPGCTCKVLGLLQVADENRRVSNLFWPPTFLSLNKEKILANFPT
jgi:hypothetical protein